MRPLYLFLSCVCLFLVYLLSGFSKLMNVNKTVDFLHGKVQRIVNVPKIICFVCIILAIALQILGTLLILFSAYTGKYRDYAYYTILLFILFNIVVTLIFHFPPVGDNYYDSLKNLSITGGFLILLDQFKSVRL